MNSIQEHSLFEKLQDAFYASSRNSNLLVSVLDSIAWDETFYDGEEYYFVLDRFIFSTPNLDAIECEWEPSAMFSSGEVLRFKL